MPLSSSSYLAAPTVMSLSQKNSAGYSALEGTIRLTYANLLQQRIRYLRVYQARRPPLRRPIRQVIPTGLLLDPIPQHRKCRISLMYRYPRILQHLPLGRIGRELQDRGQGRVRGQVLESQISRTRGSRTSQGKTSPTRASQTRASQISLAKTSLTKARAKDRNRRI
jgi:hypothetical protein